MTSVTVVDYGRGNLHSVLNALRHLQIDATVAMSGEQLGSSGPVLLPGVGAFGDAMQELRSRGHDEALRRHVGDGRPLLGICLGMQLLFDESTEFGRHPGLGLIPGHVAHLPAGVDKVPHVGWARLRERTPGRWHGTPLADLPADAWAYFVHSYHAVPSATEDVVAVCDHGGEQITAAVARDSVFGVQFHPEKSGPSGLQILRAFCEGT